MDGLALDTEVRTTKGWSTVGEIRTGDRLVDREGLATVVIATTEAEPHPAYQLRLQDGTEIIAGQEHKWVTSDREEVRRTNRDLGRHESVRTTAELYATRIDPTARTYDQANHAVITADPLDLPAQSLPVDPYVMGAWLGSRMPDEPMIMARPRDAEEIIDNLAGAGMAVTAVPMMPSTMSRRTVVALHSTDLSRGLRKADALGSRRIPPKYLNGSLKQRRRLLMGLMDVRGYMDLEYDHNGPKAPRYRLELYEDDAALEDVSELIHSLGIVPRIRRRRQSVTFTITRQTELASVQSLLRTDIRTDSHRVRMRYITSIELLDHEVPMRGIEVDASSGTFLVTKTLVPTHDCWIP